MLIDGPQQGGGGGGFLDSLGGLAGGIGRGISSGASAVAEGLSGLGGGLPGPFFNPTPDIGPVFDGGFSLPSWDDLPSMGDIWGGLTGGGDGGGPFYNPTPQIPTGLLDFGTGDDQLPTGLMDPYDNPWLM